MYSILRILMQPGQYNKRQAKYEDVKGEAIIVGFHDIQTFLG